MKRFILASLLAVAMSGLSLGLTAKENKNDPYAGYDESVYMDMGLEDNLKVPAVGKAEHAAVKAYMSRIGHNLAQKNYIVDLMRDDEVVLVTIPTDDLFAPNDTLLSQTAAAKLRPIISHITDPMMFKVVYAVHTDNTGSPTYNLWLSHERNTSIYDWFLNNVSEDLIIIPYELGDTDPLVPNDSRKGRRENRRLEIFLIPGPKLISMAQKGTLK